MLFEFTVTTWLWLLCDPPDTGVIEIAEGVPAEIEMTESTVAVTVVLVLWVAADANAGVSATTQAAKPSESCFFDTFRAVMIFFLFTFQLYFVVAVYVTVLV